MNKEKIENTLILNGYKKHPVYSFYWRGKTMIGYVFCLFPDKLAINKVKWGQININDGEKIVTYKQFNPGNFGLVTEEAIQAAKLKTLSKIDRNRRLNKNKQRKNQEPNTGQTISIDLDPGLPIDL